MKKPKTIRQLVKIADRWFSQFIRLEAATDTGYCTCITCDRAKRWNEGMHAGHFIVRVWMRTRYDSLNVWPQCNYCNTWLGGSPENYYPFMVEKCGEDGIAELKLLSRKAPNSLSREELEEIIEQCKRGVKLLKRAKGL